MQKFCLGAIVVILSFGCSPTSYIAAQSGFRDIATIKKVNYRCDFDKIATGRFAKISDYCGKADNADYVSYFVPPDTRSADIYKTHIMQLANMSAKYLPKQYRYYQIYSENNIDRLDRYDVSTTRPISYALKIGKSYSISIPKADLLARMSVYPELTLSSISQDIDTKGDHLRDYSVNYTIAPFKFSVKYTNAEIGKYLGLPKYTTFSSGAKEKIDKYNTMLALYWRNPSGYVADAISAVDYAIPQLGKNRFAKGAKGAFDIEPTKSGGYLINDYLPSYDLQRIEIAQIDSKNHETIIKTFNRQDMYRVIVSGDDRAALSFSTTLSSSNDLLIRYVHKANSPVNMELSDDMYMKFGLEQAYFGLAQEIHTNMRITKYYDILQLPRICVNVRKFKADMMKAGISAAKTDRAFNMLADNRGASCTAAQNYIASKISELMLPFVQ